MPNFSQKSRERLDSCHPDIQAVCSDLIRFYDFTVLEGHRTAERQADLFQQGLSTLDGVTRKSKHQSHPSLAIDIAPYPIDFSDKEKMRARFYQLSGYFLAIAAVLYDSDVIDSKFRFGGDWDMDGMFNDQTFDDLVHMEII